MLFFGIGAYAKKHNNMANAQEQKIVCDTQAREFNFYSTLLKGSDLDCAKQTV